MLKLRRRVVTRAIGAAATPKRPFVEMLEDRRLLSLSAAFLSPSAVYGPPASYDATANTLFPAAAQPTVRFTTPANGDTNVNRDAFITVAVNLVSSGNGVDQTTLNTDNVKIYRTSDKQFVNSLANTTGGGDGIVVKPTALLASNTNFTLEITSGVKDTAGNAFVPFKMTFTTGTGVAAVDANIRFDKVGLPNATGRQFSSLTIGPDGKLYAGTMDGAILRFTIGSDGQLGVPEVFSTVKNKNGGLRRFIIGLEFDPASTASNLILWVSHAQGKELDADDWTGKISRLTGPTLSGYTDYVINLPRSVRDHMNNQIRFGPDGALYMFQGAMNSMGAADVAWARPEHLMTAAMWRMDVHNIQSVVDVKTADGGGTYDPFAAGAPVTLVATGVRNAFDFVFHPNGHIYAAGNGSFAGGDTPAGPNNDPPALTNVNQTENDWLFDIVPGKYYGHPNPLREEYTLDGGNPTSGVDYEEITAYPVGTQPQANYQRAAYTFGMDYAPTGMLVYQSNTFGGKLKGRMLVARYSGGDDIFILTPDAADPTRVTGISGVGMDGLFDPVDIVEDTNNGNIYVSQFATDGGLNIILLKVHEQPAITSLKLINADAGFAIQSLRNKSTIDLAQLPTRNLSVRADTFGPTASVIFDYDGIAGYQVESTRPFAIQGNNADLTYKVWTPTIGKHTITVTPFEGADGSGSAGTTYTVRFTVVDSSTTAPGLFKANINFQPETDLVVPPKYKTDIGRAYGKRSNGLTYGWSVAMEGNMVNRDDPRSIDERFDTFAVMSRQTWNILVPNGTYSVYVAAGDVVDPTGNYGIAVEGILAISGKPSASKPYLGKTLTVVVKDGKLTLSTIKGTTANKLDFVQIAQIA